MNRVILLFLLLLGGSNAVQAHTSQAQGIMHIAEYLWLAPILLPLWFAYRLVRSNRC